MHFGDGLKAAISSISSHKLRSALTLIGMVIGVMAVVTMFSSIYAIKALVNKNMEGMGWNFSIVIVPGDPGQQESTRSAFRSVRRAAQSVQILNFEDYLALKDKLEYKTIYGMIENNALFRRNNKDLYVRLRATENSFFSNKSFDISNGRLFNQQETDYGAAVAVIGYKFAQDHYGKGNPLGKTLVLGKHRFKIVGVLGSDQLNSGNGMNFNQFERDEEMKAVYVPLKYGVFRFGTGKGVHQIYLQASDEASFNTMKSRARQLLLSRHNMYPNFMFVDVGAMMLTITNEMESIMKKWSITLSAIASISLIVGGIGLFSTLLISIQERMTEIGIRKSIGATDADIFIYFIMEAITLAFTGAVLGVAIAGTLLTVVGNIIKFPLYLPMAGVAIGLSFSLIIGFVSGLYPALKAAGIDPIVAINSYE
ncbi:MAG TPA: ABC transporter permease [Candidatus Cloacimonadota bacterium]|nr:ABC transporter permease [Candidatus Cloacimonadota bacterium]